MRAGTWLTRPAVVASGLLLVLTGAVPALAADTGPAASGLIYVATTGSGPVKIYAATSHGGVAPVSTVGNPHLGRSSVPAE